MKKSRVIQWVLCGVLMVVWPMPFTGVSAARSIRIEDISQKKNPCCLEVTLSARPAYKIVQIEDNEIFAAFKETSISKAVCRKIQRRSPVDSIEVETPSTGIVTLTIKTRPAVQNLTSKWMPARRMLVIHLCETQSPVPDVQPRMSPQTDSFPKIERKKPARGIRNKSASDSTVSMQKQTKESRQPPDGKFSGSLEDWFAEFENHSCFNAAGLKPSAVLYDKQLWQKAFDTITPFIQANPSDSCLTKACYLKAFSFFRQAMMDADDRRLLEAAGFFQDAINLAPDSDDIPYAFAALGKIHLQLNNPVQASGYFNLVRDQYPKYRGMPEIVFELGRSYAGQDKTKKAIPLFREGISKYPGSRFVTDTRIELGKALSKEKNYREALDILLPVFEADRRRMFASPDLLLNIGNACYKLGESAKARETLTRAYNFFPEIETKDKLLTQIADSYVEQKQPDKAVKIYRFVVENFPETQGFVTSSMRLAQYSKDPAEKEKIYRMVGRDFPDHALARLAMLRLADLYNANGDYGKSIETIEALLLTRPKALKNEALLIMQTAYRKLFDHKLKAGDYPSVIVLFEKARPQLSRLESPEIFMAAGRAYFLGHLYEQAFENFDRAFDLFKVSKRPAGLVFDLCVTLQELQRYEEALNMLADFIRDFPKDSRIKDAFRRKGEILRVQKHYRDAAENFRAAGHRCNESREKVMNLMAEADAYQAMGNYKTAVEILIKAIDLLASAPEADFKMLADAYRALGEIHLKREAFYQAADAFSMSIKFAGKDSEAAEIQFAVADSYQKANALDKAVEMYKSVIASEDPFWGKLAGERVKEIDLKTKLEDSDRSSR